MGERSKYYSSGLITAYTRKLVAIKQRDDILLFSCTNDQRQGAVFYVQYIGVVLNRLVRLGDNVFFFVIEPRSTLIYDSSTAYIYRYTYIGTYYEENIEAISVDIRCFNSSHISKHTISFCSGRSVMGREVGPENRWSDFLNDGA